MQQSREHALEQQGARESGGNSIFAGLAFPSVPTSEVIVRGPASLSAGAAVSNIVPAALSTESSSDASVAWDDALLLFSQRPAVIDGAVASSSQAPTHPPPSRLASLYADSGFKLDAKPSNYPDLSLISGKEGGDATSGSGSANACARSSSVDSHRQKSSSIPAVDMASFSRIASEQEDERANLLTQSNQELINELVSENARLAEENARLRGLTDRQQSKPQAVEKQSANRTPTIVDNSHGTLELALHNPAQGVRVSSGTITNNNANARDKYISCGTCRQWLQAPRDAVYVFCPHCRCVNNCSLLSASSSNTNTAGPALSDIQAIRNARANDDSFLPCYITDCFQGVFR